MDFSQMKQALELKSKIDKAQKELGKITVEAEAAKGDIKVVANGQQKIMSIEIAAEAINPAKAKVLQDNIIRAVNDALDKAKKAASKELSGLMGGLNLPGM